MHIRLSTLGLIAAMSVVTGCGGGSSTTGSTGGSSATTATEASSNGGSGTAVSIPAPSGQVLTAAQLATRGVAICKRLNTEIEIGKVSNLSSTNLARIATRRVAFERAALAELSKLTPPVSIESAWRQFLTLRATVVEDLEKLKDDALANNTAGQKEVLISSATIEQRMLAPAKRSGVKTCAYVI